MFIPGIRTVLACAGLCAALAACSDPETRARHDAMRAKLNTSDSRHQALLAMPLLDYYQTTIVASRIGARCAGLSHNAIADLELNERRNEMGRGSFSAIGRKKEILAAADAREQAVVRQYGSLCAAGQQEFARGSSPMSYLLTSS
ncbi:hypothetical protein ACFMBG_10740 [Leisingera sp. D0M16]|uniref:hypothetical protein n=1 Tax=Leisingera coralii TaxID=3351347 RepID=UPI003B814CF0